VFVIHLLQRFKYNLVKTVQCCMPTRVTYDGWDLKYVIFYWIFSDAFAHALMRWSHAADWTQNWEQGKQNRYLRQKVRRIENEVFQKWNTNATSKAWRKSQVKSRHQYDVLIVIYTGKPKRRTSNCIWCFSESSNCVWAVCWCVCCILNKSLIWSIHLYHQFMHIR